jgi:mannose-6-phosphate isomerase-like protein (cupin superfamily)
LAAVEPTNLHRTESFVTADGSSIREVAGRVSQATRNQSLAQATVPPGGETAEHYHVEAEEVYLFTAGAGRMRLGEEEFAVADGDCVVIAPGIAHKLWAAADDALVLLCSCAPAYRHEDTVLTGR